MAIVEDNVDNFEVHPIYAVAAVLPDRDCVDRAIASLETDDDDVIEVLYGDEGLRILDQRGTRHGKRAWLHRVLQQWTYYEEILGLYTERLAAGEFLVVVPSGPGDRHRIGGTLAEHRAHGVYFFGFNTVESLTAP